MSPSSFKNVINEMRLHIIYRMYIHKEDLASNKPQGLINHKIQPNQTSQRILSIANRLGEFVFFFK